MLKRRHHQIHRPPLTLLVSSSSSIFYLINNFRLFLPKCFLLLLREEEYSSSISSSSDSSSSSLCSSIIRTSIEKGSPHQALHHYQTILCSGNIQPDYQMISYVLHACNKISSSDSSTDAAVNSMHSRIFKSGFHSYPSLLISLLAVYAAHNHIHHAHRVFEEIPNWSFSILSANLIIAGYLRTGQFDLAMRFFQQQQQMPHRDVVSWNTMIMGCLKISRPNQAIGLFRQMLDSGFEPDGFTFASVLTACGRTGALTLGEWAHNLMIHKQTDLNFILTSALVDMYSKCGRIKAAKQVFNNSVQRDHISVWNSMIIGLAFHGLASEVIDMFSRLKKSASVEPDSITFIGILTACNHCGMVGKGREFFDLMTRQYNIEPELEHYGAMVDLLGRAGLLEEAQAMIRTMPMEPDAVIWRSLLSACRIHGKPELGEIAIERMVNLGSGDYVLLSNIYSSTRRWDRAEKVRELMKKKGVRKGHGLSWVEIKGVIHQFKAGDHSHPESNAIYKVLDGLSKRLKFNGFMPAVELVLMDVTEEDKEGNLKCHSEKLAVAYGILKTSPGTEIRVSKNLRTCYDCHLWIKMVSKVLNRIIVMRDRVRFHRFENGCCSCRDYW